MLVLVLRDAVWAQGASAVSPKTVTDVLDKSISGGERAVLALGQMMPADRCAFVPSNREFTAVRTYGQMLKHVAVDTPPVQVHPRENGPDSLVEKEAILKFVRDSFAYLRRAVATVNERNLMQSLSYPGGGQVTRLAVVLSASARSWDLYGQMIEYLRMNGIDPQKAH